MILQNGSRLIKWLVGAASARRRPWTPTGRPSTPRHVLNAVGASTGEPFTVVAGTLYETAVELAGQVGVELEDG